MLHTVHVREVTHRVYSSIMTSKRILSLLLLFVLITFSE